MRLTRSQRVALERLVPHARGLGWREWKASPPTRKSLYRLRLVERCADGVGLMVKLTEAGRAAVEPAKETTHGE